MSGMLFEIMGAGRRGGRGLRGTSSGVLGVGSKIGFESGSEFYVVGRPTTRYRIIADLTAVRTLVTKSVTDYGDGGIPGVVVLESSVLGSLVTDSLVGRLTDTGEAAETLPAGTIVQCFGMFGGDVPISGGWAYVISPSADSTYTKWYGMRVAPVPCPDGQWRTAEGECVPLVTVTPTCPEGQWRSPTTGECLPGSAGHPIQPSGWTTGQKVALGAGILVVFGGIVYALSR